MALAYWCVLVAALLPLVCVAYAKSGGEVGNRYPRGKLDRLPQAKARAYAAHLNAYENFPFFAAAVIVALTQGASVATVNLLAVLYVALRVIHGLLYIADQATPRSAVYALALFVNIAIFVLPAFR